MRYAPSGVLVGATRQRHFDGTNFKPRKLLENAATPTTIALAHFAGDRAHAVLGGLTHGENAYLTLARPKERLECCYNWLWMHMV